MNYCYFVWGAWGGPPDLRLPPSPQSPRSPRTHRSSSPPPGRDRGWGPKSPCPVGARAYGRYDARTSLRNAAPPRWRLPRHPPARGRRDHVAFGPARGPGYSPDFRNVFPILKSSKKRSFFTIQLGKLQVHVIFSTHFFLFHVISIKRKFEVLSIYYTMKNKNCTFYWYLKLISYFPSHLKGSLVFLWQFLLHVTI